MPSRRKSKAKGRGEELYSADVPSDLALKDPYIAEMIAELDCRGLIDGPLSKTTLVIEEMITNGIRHGNNHDPGKSVHVELSKTRRGWAVEMTDEGEGFDPDSVPDPRTPEGLFGEGGRGLLIIRSFMDKVEFRMGGARIRCEKYVAAPKPPLKKSPRKKAKKKPAKKRPARAAATKKPKKPKKPKKKAPARRAKSGRKSGGPKR